jgi:hypothetical protein
VKRAFIAAFVMVFVFGTTLAFAGDENPGTAKKAGCCASKAQVKGTAATALSDEEKEEKVHVCPDVIGKTALEEFHQAMHPMHLALGEENFEEFSQGLPKLMNATENLADYKCDGYEKCSEACRKNFDGKKADLIQSVDRVSEACISRDREKMTANFDVMHEAYITFANTCAHPERGKAEKVMAKEKKAE